MKRFTLASPRSFKLTHEENVERRRKERETAAADDDDDDNDDDDDDGDILPSAIRKVPKLDLTKLSTQTKLTSKDKAVTFHPLLKEEEEEEEEEVDDDDDDDDSETSYEEELADSDADDDGDKATVKKSSALRKMASFRFYNKARKIHKSLKRRMSHSPKLSMYDGDSDEEGGKPRQN